MSEIRTTSAAVIAVPGVSLKRTLGLVAELTKARLSSLVLLTTAVGMYAGTQGTLDAFLLMSTLLGTALLAGGAGALNQYLERTHDARMHRTQNRPLPAGLIKPETALLSGGLMAVAGVVYLALAVNLLTSVLGSITLMIYLFIYTPLKRRTTWNTVVGAIPGALPPLMGWAAARNDLALAGWSLFAVLFFWQLPHFLAISWLYREDYARADFKMLAVEDHDGVRTGRHAVTHTVGLISFSLTPALLGVTGIAYFIGAFLLGSLFLTAAILFARRLTRAWARALFFASIVYLPLLLGLIVLDKVQ
jgi:protoheme IX farnesyltransferase